MKLRGTTTPSPGVGDVESTVRDRLYGGRREVRATPLRERRPTLVGARYQLLERIGSGATADVYRARDERLGRYVAAKVVVSWLADDTATVRRFQREAEFSARLAHRNVVAVLDAGSRPREHIVMELVDGKDVATLLVRDHAFTASVAVDVLVQICDALDHAHGCGVIHGDVAPRNILLGSDGTAKLADFGAAVDRVRGRRSDSVMGTPGYMAPEIVRGSRPTPQSDLYSLGVVGKRLLGDHVALAAATAEEPRARPASAAELRLRLLATRSDVSELRAA